MDAIQQGLPIALLFGAAGYAIGFINGRRARADEIISSAREVDLLDEVKRRRLRERLGEEIDRQVESEAGERPVAF